jgi:hypothetical protein
MDPKKIANNILEFMFDPTRIPVKERLYFRPEETLRNESFEAAKANSYKAYGEERHNSDFYPIRNRMQTHKEAALMDRKTMIASLDVLSQHLDESDPIGKDLRTMAYVFAKMDDATFETRMAKKKMEFVECPKCGNKKVLKQTGYCIKCGKKGIGKDKKASDEEIELNDFWSKEASMAVQKAILSDVIGNDDDDKDDEKDAGKKAPVVDEDEKDAGKKAPVVDEDEKDAGKKAPVVDEDEKDAGKKAPVVDEDEKDAGKKAPVMDEDEKDAGKKAPVMDEDEKDAAKKKVEPDEKKVSSAKKTPVVDEDEKDAAKKAPIIDEDEKDAAKKAPVVDEDEKDAAKKQPKEDDKEKVDTTMLAYDGIEIGEGVAGLVSTDELGELTAEDKAKLDMLFK